MSRNFGVELGHLPIGEDDHFVIESYRLRERESAAPPEIEMPTEAADTVEMGGGSDRKIKIRRYRLTATEGLSGGAKVSLSQGHSSETGSDTATETVNTAAMNEISREELNARLEALETKMDARADALASKIDKFLAVQAERDQRFNEQLKSSIALSDEWNQKFRMLAEQSVSSAASADASAKEAATLKTHFWASVIAQLLAVGAIVVGAYFANQANVLSAVSTTVSVFQAGKDQAKQPDPPVSSGN